MNMAIDNRQSLPPVARNNAKNAATVTKESIGCCDLQLVVHTLWPIDGSNIKDIMPWLITNIILLIVITI